MSRTPPADERGIVLVIVAAGAAALFLIAAIVIDLSMLRSDRRSNQLAVDAAATAGAISLATDGGQAACTATVGYLKANLPNIGSLSGISCSAFPTACVDGTTTPVTATTTSGDYSVTIVHPVPNGHALMASSAIGSPRPAMHAADGAPCDRIGVQVTLSREALFGRIAGPETRTTSVHAVAIASPPTNPVRPINVLVLERHECQAVHVTGGGQIVVDKITGPDSTTEPGTLAADSDGTETCDGGETLGVLDVDGSGALLRADGPVGCAESTPDIGEGCGTIEVVAPGVPGNADYCVGSNELPACQSTGIVRPNPVQMSEALTRAPIDHRYNCKSSYASEPWFAEHDIVGCTGTGRAYIDELKSYVDGVAGDPASAGWNIWGDEPATEPCTIEGDAAPTGVGATGNWFVTCSPFIVKREFRFPGGNVIFDGDVVVVGGTGHLRLNGCSSCPSSVSFTDGDDFDESQFATDAAWVAFRAGDGIFKAGAAQLTISGAMLLFTDPECEGVLDDGELTERCAAFEGGPGALVWSAPSEGPFDDLALWSEGTRQHDFAGQANLGLEGVFFVPSATAFYRGNGTQQQVSAQFISEKLIVVGGGALVVRPIYQRAVLFPEGSRSQLIR